MDLETLALAAGSALVGTMSTDLWEHTKSVAVGWWRQVHPERAVAVEAELTAAGAELAAARAAGDGDAEAELVVDWQRRLRRLLLTRPELAAEIRRMVDELAPRPPEPESRSVVKQEVRVSDHGTAYVAGRDQHISGR
ncbi:hypothetical protein ACFWBN_06025 [Streptomyces sp. NPDC059989]|uniref:hypothetical protein n=1 Tax=Streptomyces sp. NPDC059989 TaxID=3347026 RepID=UPI0036BCE834